MIYRCAQAARSGATTCRGKLWWCEGRYKTRHRKAVPFVRAATHYLYTFDVFDARVLPP